MRLGKENRAYHEIQMVGCEEDLAKEGKKPMFPHVPAFTIPTRWRSAGGVLAMFPYHAQGDADEVPGRPGLQLA